MFKRFQFLACILLMTLLVVPACNSSRHDTELTPTEPQVPESSPTPVPTPISGLEDEPFINVQPGNALADEVVKIQVVGLAPGQTVTLRASVRDDLDHLWGSYATFISDRNGIVDVTTQAPISGTYDIVDPMGLFWSMLPTMPGREYPCFANFDTYFMLVTITAEINNEQIATAYIKRIRLQQDVDKISVHEDGLVGYFYSPNGEGPYPTLIILGGSGGGVDIGKAALLASHGYATLALAYFGVPPLPKELSEIPLEYFETAIDWLKSQDVVDGDRIGVIGASRGGELALLLGATFPDLKAVIGYMPSGVVLGNYTSTSVGEKAAWTYHGNPIPFAIEGDTESIEAATIPVEKINGPILLISGKDDQIWPSTELSEIAIVRLKKYDHPYPYEHLSYEGAGHSIMLPYWPSTVNPAIHPVTGEKMVYGGTAKGNAYASADAWAHVLEFLESNLKNSAP